MNAIQLLINDHKTVKGLFTQAVASEARAPEMRRGVLRELYMALEVHAKIEEEIFYPALRSNPETAGLIESSFDDHAEVKELIHELRALGQEGGGFDERLEELIDGVITHAEVEERELFPLAEKLIGDQLDTLGARMAALKEAQMGQKKYRLAQPEKVQNFRGGEQMRKI